MKVIYEFDTENPEHVHERRMIDLSTYMYSALLDISEYVRSINKERIDPTQDEMIEKISEFLYDSRMHEIE